MRSLWRRFVAWLNADDVLHEATFFAIPPKFVPPAHSQHCPTCAASRVPDSLRTDYERALIAKEWTAHYKENV